MSQFSPNVALVLPREVPRKFRNLCISGPNLGINPRWDDPMAAARDSLREAGIAFDELVEDASLRSTLQFPRHRIAVLPFVDQLLPDMFEIIEAFVQKGGKVITQACYAGEYCWWADSGFHFNCYLFSHDYRGPLLANMADYLLNGTVAKPSTPPPSAPRSVPLGWWQSASLMKRSELAAWDLEPDAFIFWVATMEQPKELVEAQFVRALDLAAERGSKIWLTTHYDHPTSKGYASYFWQGKSELPYSDDFVKRLKPATREALQGYVLGEAGSAQYGKLAYFTEASDMRDAAERFRAGLKPRLDELRRKGMRTVAIFEHSLNHHQNYDAGADISQLELCAGMPEPLGIACGGGRGMARAHGKPFVSAISIWYGAYRIGQYADSPEALWDTLHISYLFDADEIHMQAEPMGTSLVCGKAPREKRPVTAGHEETLAEFSRWTRTVERKGEPVVSIAMVKGHFDGWPGHDSEAGVYGLGRSFHLEQNEDGRWVHMHDAWHPVWKMGAPEHCWRIYDVFYPPTHPFDDKAIACRVSSTPYGLIECFHAGATAAHMKTFRLLILTGWNTMTSDLASRLSEYVRGGGTLLLGLPQLSSHVRREDMWDGNYKFDVKAAMAVAGFEITGRGKKQSGEIKGDDAWVTALKDISVSATGANMKTGGNAEVLLKLGDAPVLTAHRLGEGVCYCWTTWEYPGDEGVLEAFKAVCRKLADDRTEFRLHATGKVGAVPYVEADGKTWVQAVNHEATPQKIRIQFRGQKMEKEIPARSHQIFPM